MFASKPTALMVSSFVSLPILVAMLMVLLSSSLLRQKDCGLGLSNEFPSIEDTVEMAALSLIVYTFRDEMDDAIVCKQINSRNFTVPDDRISRDLDITCHYYLHDKVQGTQVMLVSSNSKRYNAICFAGTDDLRTSLADADILTKAFGDGVHVTLPTQELRNNVRIHSGFNNAVFKQDIFQKVKQNLDDLREAQRREHPLSAPYRIFTTGHSLGAANAVLTAVGLMLQYEYESKHHGFPSWWRPLSTRGAPPPPPPRITSLNFGCPRIGNTYWRDFIHTHPSVQNLAIWRIVLGWDLVPRLPKFMTHEGHTTQIYLDSGRDSDHASEDDASNDDGSNNNATAVAFYQHYGNKTLGYASVPFGWYNRPYIWVPGSLSSHHVLFYWHVLRLFNSSSTAKDDDDDQLKWIDHFVLVDDDNLNDDHPPNVDDDTWVNPPDDDIRTAEAELE